MISWKRSIWERRRPACCCYLTLGAEQAGRLRSQPNSCSSTGLEQNLLKEGTKMPKSRDSAPWWLSPGTETCPVCHQLYLYETEYRCEECDGPMCEHCFAVRESLVTVCLPCFDCADTEEA